MPSKDGPEGSRKRPHNQLDEEDVITILNAVVDFRTNHGGRVPMPSTLTPVYDAVKGNLHHEITSDQLYNRFRSLKHRYSKALRCGDAASPTTPFDRLFLDLSLRAWGHQKKRSKDADRISSIEKKSSGKKSKKIEEENGYGHEDAAAAAAAAAASADDAEEEEEDGDGEDALDTFQVLMDQARKHWEKEGMSIPALELGLKSMEKSKALTLDKRWRQYLEAEWKIEAKTIDVQKDLLTTLSAVQKDAPL